MQGAADDLPPGLRGGRPVSPAASRMPPAALGGDVPRPRLTGRLHGCTPTACSVSGWGSSIETLPKLTHSRPAVSRSAVLCPGNRYLDLPDVPPGISV